MNITYCMSMSCGLNVCQRACSIAHKTPIVPDLSNLTVGHDISLCLSINLYKISDKKKKKVLKCSQSNCENVQSAL